MSRFGTCRRMRHTYIRWPQAAEAPSARLVSRPGAARVPRIHCSVLCLIGLVLGAAGAHGQTLTRVNPHDLLTANPAAFAQLLERARPAPVSAEDKARILSSLPRDGEVSHLNVSAREKLSSLSDLLRATQRMSVYEIKVIAAPQAAIGIHARAVVLISDPALRLLEPRELQALVAHEIGHEYVWLDYERASRVGDYRRLKELELLCDSIAIITLHRLGIDPSRLTTGIEKLSRFNREHFGMPENENAYPTLAERRQFAQAAATWAAPPSSTR